MDRSKVRRNKNLIKRFISTLISENRRRHKRMQSSSSLPFSIPKIKSLILWSKIVSDFTRILKTVQFSGFLENDIFLEIKHYYGKARFFWETIWFVSWQVRGKGLAVINSSRRMTFGKWGFISLKYSHVNYSCRQSREIGWSKDSLRRLARCCPPSGHYVKNVAKRINFTKT